jgi:hypothetical protein
MKKQIFILLLFSIQASAQNAKFPKLKISVPCNQEFLDSYKGKWLIPDKILVNSPKNNYSQEAMKRITEVHELVKQIYPEPVGSDGYWRGTYSKSDFGYTIRYVTQDGGTQKEYLKRSQVEGWSYYMILFAWICSENANEMWNGYPDAGGGNAINVYANYLPVLTGEFFDDDEWTIDGRPIKVKMPVIGHWKGYDVMATNGSYQNNEWYLLITRTDMLPYVPVTRKQYLDRAIAYTTKFYDKLNAFTEQIQDKAEKDEARNRNTNTKNSTLKKLQDELEKTKKDGLLDAPAVVRPDPLLQNEGPVFLSESEGGIMLTTENPNYFRKDLPAYIPQLFVLTWSWGTKKWETDFRKAIEDNFPIEKLQAMIDQ